LATIGIKVDTNFQEASNDLKGFTNLTAKETARIKSNLKRLEDFQANSFIQKNKRMALAVKSTQGATAALAAEHRGLQREIQRLIRAGVDPMDDKLKQLRQEYNRTSAAMDRAGGKTRNWGSALTTLAIAATTAFFALRKMLSTASNLAEQTTKFNKVFSDSTVNMGKAVDELRFKYAMSTREARQFLASTQDLLKPLGVLPNLAAKMSGNITKLAADIGSFNNMPTADVIRAIQSALVGSFRPMRQFGVDINQNKLFLEALNMKLVTHKNQMTSAIKAQAAWSLIQKGSVDATGDMIRTGGSYANQLKFMKARLEELTATLGKVFLPIATKIISVISTIAAWFTKLPGPIKTLIIVVTALGAVILVATKVVMAFGVAFSAAIWPVTLIVAAIAAVIAITILLVKKWNIVKKILINIWRLLRASFEMQMFPMRMIIITIVNGIIAAVTWLASKVISVLKGMIKVANFAIKFIPGVKPIDTSGLDAWTNSLENASNKALGRIANTAKDVVRIGKDAVNAAKGIASGTAELFGSAAKEIKKVVSKGKKGFRNLSKSGQKNFKKISRAAQTELSKVISAFQKMNVKLMTDEQKRSQIQDIMQVTRNQVLASNLSNRQAIAQEMRNIDLEHLRENLGQSLTLETVTLAMRLAKNKQFFKALALLQTAQRKATSEAEKKARRARLEGAKTFFTNMGELAKSGGAKTFGLFKAMAIANATISGMEAAVHAWSKGMAAGGPILAAIFAAGSIARTALMISEITKQKPQASAETGGSFVVPDNPRSSRVDSQTMRVNPGENITVDPRGEAPRNMTVNVVIDRRVLYSTIQKGFDTGQITITNKNIVSFN